jgi:hypothetical protein
MVSHTAPFYGALVVPNVNAATCTEIARAPYFAQAVTSCAHELLFASCFGRPHRTQNGNSFVTPIARPSCVDAKTRLGRSLFAVAYIQPTQPVDAAQLDKIRDQLLRRCRRTFDARPLRMEVIFTARRPFDAERAKGFSEPTPQA